MDGGGREESESGGVRVVGEEPGEGEEDVPCRLTQLEKPPPLCVFCDESGVPPRTALNLNTPYFLWTGV